MGVAAGKGDGGNMAEGGNKNNVHGNDSTSNKEKDATENTQRGTKSLLSYTHTHTETPDPDVSCLYLSKLKSFCAVCLLG